MVNKTSNRYNELTGKEWLQYSFSLWKDIRKLNGEKALKHPAMFPSQLSSRIIDIYTKKNDVVLDPFMGIGSTLLSAYEKQRSGIGFELSKEFADIARKRIKELTSTTPSSKRLVPKIHVTDSRNLLKHVDNESVDLCVTSPPYWDVLNMKRSADKKEITNYGNSNVDLGNINDYEAFLTELKCVFSEVYEALKAKGHCVVVLMDIRKKDKFYPFHSDLAKKMEEIGFVFEDIIIWDRQHEYNNMKPLGYPYVFRVNKVHEYILIFRKRGC